VREIESPLRALNEGAVHHRDLWGGAQTP